MSGNIIGRKPNQVPTNADLGELAYQNRDFPDINNLRLRGSMIIGDEGSISGGSGLTRSLTVPDGSTGDLFLFGPSPEIGFFDSNADRSSAISGNDGRIELYSYPGPDSTATAATVDGTAKATYPSLKFGQFERVEVDANGSYSSGGDLNLILGTLKINGTSVIDQSRRGTFGTVGTTAAASALRVGMNNTNFANNTPTMQIYHYNYPDDGSTNVPALQIRSGNTDADAKHHGTLELAQIFTGSAYSSPMLQFKTNANSSNDKGVVMLQGLSGNTPGLIVQTDLLGSSESNSDLVPYDVFYTSAGQAYFKSDTQPRLDSGANTLRLISDRSGTDQPGSLGAGLVFHQRWWSNSTANERVGGIFGYKTGGNGIFGGGLKLYVQPHNGSDMTNALELRGDGIGYHNYSSYTYGSSTVGTGINVASTGELSGCPFTHVRLAYVNGSPYNDHFEGRLVVSGLPGGAQRYLHLITHSGGTGHIKFKLFTTRSGSEYMQSACQFEYHWYSEGDGDFRNWTANGYENIGSYYLNTSINGLPTGYLVDYASNLNASSETARDTSNNWGYAVVRVPIWINQNSSGTEEYYISLDQHSSNADSWWVGIVGH